jgi:hypothetical protein
MPIEKASNLPEMVIKRQKMPKLYDREFGGMWSQHFPVHRESDSSRQICTTITHIVRSRAASLEFTTLSDRIGEVLRSFGIAKDQFDEFEKEQKCQPERQSKPLV